jgi:peptidoglycan/LPS O-acetylase OafA/YrhL
VIATQTARSGSVGSETRLLELDGLRGIAILMVIVCHYVFAPDLAQAEPSSPRVFAFQLFSSGVDLFFVLSGFLIGGILLDHRNSPSYFTTFYGRRVFRIFPVYYGFLLLTAAAGIVLHMLGKPTPVFDAGTPYWMFVLFLQNFSIGWYGDTGWITTSMAWSLALEEQFYLTLPLAVRRLSTRTLIGISALVIAGARFSDISCRARHTASEPWCFRQCGRMGSRRDFCVPRWFDPSAPSPPAYLAARH